MTVDENVLKSYLLKVNKKKFQRISLDPDCLAWEPRVSVNICIYKTKITLNIKIVRVLEPIFYLIDIGAFTDIDWKNKKLLEIWNLKILCTCLYSCALAIVIYYA